MGYQQIGLSEDSAYSFKFIVFTPGLYTRGQRNLVGKSGYQGIGLTVLWLSVVSCSCLHQGSIHVLESDVRSMHLSQACSWSNESKLQFPFSLFMSQSLRDLIYTNATLRSPKQNKRFQFIYFPSANNGNGTRSRKLHDYFY